MTLRPDSPPTGRWPLSSRLLAGLAAALTLGVVVGTRLLTGSAPASGMPAGSPDWRGWTPHVYMPDPAPALSLVTQDGGRFSLDALRGRTVLVAFGYTNCPDVCPTTLAISREVLRARPDGAASVFVTVDPERDTPTALGQYLAVFGVPMTGLSGTVNEIRTAATAWQVTFQTGEVSDAGGYAMNHTAGVFVVDPGGRLRYHFPNATPASVLVDAVDRLTAEGT